MIVSGAPGCCALAALALICALAPGCEDRRRSRVEGTGPRIDRGVLDRGPDRGEPAGDATPGLPLDATPDLPLDAAPDFAPDATPDATAPPDQGPPPLFYRATAHDGRSGCPRVSGARPEEGVTWSVAARVALHGETLGDGWLEAPIQPPDGPGIPRYRSDAVALEAVRWSGRTAHGLWPTPDGLRTGPWRDGGWADDGLSGHGPIADRPAAFDTARSGDVRVTLLPRDDGLVLVLDAGTGALARVVEWEVDDLQSARLAADAQGIVVAWTHGGQLDLRALDLLGGERWRVGFEVAAPGFDLALTPDQVAVAHVRRDPRLADLPFAAGYGRPTLMVIGRANDAERWTTPLHPDPIRGGDPAVGARADGWLVAWARLRVDGDRNRTEIEASVIADGRTGPPLAITRAHGFSFCPAVGDAVDGASLIAWLDTRSGREEILTIHGDFADWPLPPRPEPAPAPPAFPEGCEANAPAVDGLIAEIDAVPDGGGFLAAWIDRDGVLMGGPVRPEDGATVAWALPGAAPRDVRIARAPGGSVVFARVDDRIRAWRGVAPGDGPPPAPPPMDLDLDPPLRAVAGDGSALVAVFGDPPIVARLDPGGPRRALPASAGDIRVEVVEGAALVTWRSLDAATLVELAWVTLPPDPAGWGAAEIRGVVAPGLADGEDFDLEADADGWRLLFSAHYGRRFARVIAAFDPFAADRPVIDTLDLDAASSTRPVGHAGGAIWLEERPVQRYQVHFAPPAGPVQRLPLPGPRRARMFLDVADGDPVVLWTAGVEARIARFPARCRLPAASAP